MGEKEFIDFDQHLQDCCIKLLLTDAHFIKSIRSSFMPSFFNSEILFDICQCCFDFFDKYDAIIGDHYEKVLVSFLKEKRVKDKELNIYFSYLEKLNDILPNRNYLLENIENILRDHSIKLAMINGAKLIKEDNLVEAKELLMNAFAFKIGNNDELGLDFNDYFVGQGKYGEIDDSVVMQTLIRELDSSRALKNKLKEKKSMILLAPSSVGKSWGCCYFARAGIIQGVSTIYYIIGDLNANEISERISYGLVGSLIISQENKKRGRKFSRGFDDNIINFERSTKDEFNAKLGSVRKSFMGTSKARRGGLIVKEFSAGACTVHHLENHLVRLQARKGFYPRLIILDSIEEVLPVRNYKDAREGHLEVLRGILKLAYDFNVLIIFAAQTNRAGADARIIGPKHFQDDIRRWQKVDICLGLCQTKEEYHQNRLRIYGIKNRNGPKYFHIEMITAYEVGQFILDSQWVRHDSD